jgi:hypothetical protein
VSDEQDRPDPNGDSEEDLITVESIRDSPQVAYGRGWATQYLKLDPRFNEGDANEQPDVASVRIETSANVRTFRKDEHDAITRRWLAFVVLGVLSVFYGASVLGLLMNWIDMDELGRLALVLGPIQALTAAVLGFYFGQDKGR